MRISPLTPEVERLIRDQALFNSEVDSMTDNWNIYYSHPLSLAYMQAKNRLDQCVNDAVARGRERAEAYAQMKARIDFAVGVAFALLGPLATVAQNELKLAITISENDLDARLLRRSLAAYYSPQGATDADFTRIFNQERVRQVMLNYTTDRAMTAVAGQIAPGSFSPGAMTAPGAPSPTGQRGALAAPRPVSAPVMPLEFFSGEFSSERFELNMRNIFERLGSQMKTAYREMWNSGAPEAQRRAFLGIVLKSVLLRPPSEQINIGRVPSGVLAADIFQMIAPNYILSFRAAAGSAWPTIGLDLAYQINRAFAENGRSIVLNNPTAGVADVFPPAIDNQLAWDGGVSPPVRAKLAWIANDGAMRVEGYMAALAAA